MKVSFCYYFLMFIFYLEVYDVTDYLKEHPGGDDLIMEHSGRDASRAFHSKPHSKKAQETLKRYLIGTLINDN